MRKQIQEDKEIVMAVKPGGRDQVIYRAVCGTESSLMGRKSCLWGIIVLLAKYRRRASDGVFEN